MYVTELALWFGWAVFYGGVGVLIGFTIFVTVLAPGVSYRSLCSTRDSATRIARTGAMSHDGSEHGVVRNRAAVIAEQLRANDTYQTVLTARLLRIAASEVSLPIVPERNVRASHQ